MNSVNHSSPLLAELMAPSQKPELTTGWSLLNLNPWLFNDLILNPEFSRWLDESIKGGRHGATENELKKLLADLRRVSADIAKGGSSRDRFPHSLTVIRSVPSSLSITNYLDSEFKRFVSQLRARSVLSADEKSLYRIVLRDGRPRFYNRFSAGMDTFAFTIKGLAAPRGERGWILKMPTRGLIKFFKTKEELATYYVQNLYPLSVDRIVLAARQLVPALSHLPLDEILTSPDFKQWTHASGLGDISPDSVLEGILTENKLRTEDARNYILPITFG